MMYTDATLQGLAHLRLAARTGLGLSGAAREAFEALDNAGVFAALDEQTDYASAVRPGFTDPGPGGRV
jgi:hypothetical protein